MATNADRISGEAWVAAPGFRFAERLLTADEHDALLRSVRALRYDEVRMRGQVARRTVRHFGVSYDYDTHALRETDPIPDWLSDARIRCAQLLGVEQGDIAEALVTCYPPGAAINWHRDAPAFGGVVGVSLGAAARLRMRPLGETGRSAVVEQPLPPGSGYAFTGTARWRWQHSIPPVTELRYSVTFRTIRPRGA
jgi:DNA oxidative demethylase